MLSWWLRTSIRKEYGMRFSGRPVDKRHFCVLIYRKRCLAEASQICPQSSADSCYWCIATGILKGAPNSKACRRHTFALTRY